MMMMAKQSQHCACFGTDRYVNAMNRRGLSYSLAVNHLADWTQAEREQLSGKFQGDKASMVGICLCLRACERASARARA